MATVADGGSGYVWSSLMQGSTVATNRWYDRGGKKISRFTPHFMAGNMTAQDCANMFCTTDRKVSSNYCIGSDGTIWGNVPEQYGAWTSSNHNNDEIAITVEVANVNNSTGEITQEAWNSLVNLGADICSRYGFSLQWEDSWSQGGEWNNHKDNSLTIHRMFSDTDCPGQYLMDHLTQLANEVNSKIGAPLSGSSGGTASSSTTAMDANSLIPANVINLEFSYGYNDGQMSEVHRGVMTEYDVNFNAYGSTLTIEGVSREFVSFNDPKSVTYKGMTIEEIVRSIAEEEGWIVEDDSIEPIADVKESEVYSLTTGTGGTAANSNIYSGNTLVAGGSGGTLSDGPINTTQQKLIDAANAHTEGASGYCAAWAWECFENAGLAYPWGNACDAYDQWCTSSNKADLKPGMIIAVKPSGATGNAYGHVGIYIGNDTVRHNAGGSVINSSVDEWINTYGPNGSHPHSNPVKWGWASNNDLTKLS